MSTILRRTRFKGHGTEIPAEGATISEDTFTCCHCNCVIFYKVGEDISQTNGFCMRCMAHVCKTCNKDGRCTPFEKKLEAAEARDRLLRAVCV